MKNTKIQLHFHILKRMFRNKLKIKTICLGSVHYFSVYFKSRFFQSLNIRGKKQIHKKQMTRHQMFPDYLKHYICSALKDVLMSSSSIQ